MLPWVGPDEAVMRVLALPCLVSRSLSLSISLTLTNVSVTSGSPDEFVAKVHGRVNFYTAFPRLPYLVPSKNDLSENPPLGVL